MYSRVKVIIAALMCFVFGVIYWGKSDKPNVQTEQSEPTTAILKVVDYGPAYLRLEQEHSTVIARFLLTCFDGQVHLNAGIVTTPERSQLVMKKMIKNYLEFDSEVILPALKNDGAKAVDSALWIARPLDPTQVALLKTADVLGAWTEDGSDFRWGAFMHIDSVRGEIKSYVENCKN
jgi:hypothetical protein